LYYLAVEKYFKTKFHPENPIRQF